MIMLIYCSYYLYANTKLGLWFYKRELQKARQKLNNQPHSVTEPFKQNGLCIAHFLFKWISTLLVL